MSFYKYTTKCDINTEEVNTCNVVLEENNFDVSFTHLNLSNIILDENNLLYLCQNFDMPINRILQTFIPVGLNGNYITIEDVKKRLESNSLFYSFLAEITLPLVYKSIYNYDLVNGVIQINATLNDTHTGIDSCLMDQKNNLLVIGEAKFYKNFNSACNSIIKDFSENSFLNKLDSFKRNVANNSEATMIFRTYSSSDILEININDLAHMNLVIAGFIISENGTNSLRRFDKKKLEETVSSFKKIVTNSGDIKLIILDLSVLDKPLFITQLINKVMDIKRSYK